MTSIAASQLRTRASSSTHVGRSTAALDALALVGVNALVIVAMWLRHGGLAELGSPVGVVTAAGQLMGLFAAYAALLQIVLMARTPWLDQIFGMTNLAAWHRILGFSTLGLLVGHGALSPLGLALATGSSWPAELLVLTASVPFMLFALVGGALFIVVAVSSMRAARRRLPYEAWYWIHVSAYLAVLLGFGHQLVIGTDFVADPLARSYWIALYLAAAAGVLLFRFGQPILLTRRHRFVLAAVVPETPGVVSLYVTGRNLHRLPVRAGQYFHWRFLTRDGWWRAHPFSLSAAPNGQYLRLTVKELGDWSKRLATMPIGTRLMAEGPYGTLTQQHRQQRKVALIAGGIGITPLRALLEERAANGEDTILLYRAHGSEDLVFRAEIDELAKTRGVRVHYLLGARQEKSGHALLSPAHLRALVGDILVRDVYLCGPGAMMDAVRSALRTVGVPKRQIHFERFGY